VLPPPESPHRHLPGPQALLRQVAEAMRASEGRPTEIALAPRELGRLRVRIETRDSTATLVIVAERPETAELMRRHIDLLVQDFRDLGFAELDIAFRDPGQGGAGGEADAAPQPGNAGKAHADDASAPPAARIAAGGLDLRL
jgi:flagellar hook-length control protein FliK